MTIVAEPVLTVVRLQTRTPSPASGSTSSTTPPPVRTSARTPAEAARQRRTVSTLQSAREADREAARRARNSVVEDHLDVAEALALRYGARRRDLADIRQVAFLGLVKAAERFDGERGQDFVAFAVATVRGEIKRHLRDYGWLVRPPRHLQEIRAAAAHAEDDLRDSGHARPSLDDLAAAVGCTVDDLREAQGVQDDSRVLSLDMPVSGSEGVPFGQLLGYDEPGFDRVDRTSELAPALRGLAPRDLEVLRLRYAEELSQQEIGRRIGVTQMQVSRILARLLRELRCAFGQSPAAAALECRPEPGPRLSA